MLISCYMSNKEMSKKSKKSMKIADLDGEVLHIFWTTCGISVKFSGKMWLMILKVTKNQGFTLSLEDTFLEKPQPPSLLRAWAFDFQFQKQKQTYIYIYIHSKIQNCKTKVFLPCNRHQNSLDKYLTSYFHIHGESSRNGAPKMI